ncbi:MAG: Gfo/Idh/MocA family oxidoreductase [Planctomycetes bacterium]|nr:Gfo/Idh/MocA family oxidoreductase [Planctomycetota bacterium]
MDAGKLTAAVLGLNDSGQHLLQAAAATGCFQIQAVADLDPQKAEKAAAEHHCQAYSDYRQLIVQNQLDCLLVAAETHTCDEQLKTALKKKFHVLKTAPLGRTFEESRECVRLAESEGVRLAVANPARFQSSFQALREMIAQGRLEHVFLMAASCSFGAADPPGWRADPKLAGGGVLLHDCYQLFDQLLLSFPLPEQVYALQTNQAPDKQQRLYLTEDTAVVCLRFNDALMGSVVATRRNETGPHRVWIEVRAKEALLTVTEDQVELRTRDGRNDWKRQYDEPPQVATERLLSSFARSLRDPEQFPLVSSGGENLRTMAVLESAYLSARTGFPEEPARILQWAGPAPRAASSARPSQGT